MNVLLTEINDNPKEKLPTWFNPIVKKEIRKYKDFVSQNFDDPKIVDKLFNDRR